MQLNERLILKNWGMEGVDFFRDLAARWGVDKLPEPNHGETFERFAIRCAQDGLVHLAGPTNDLRSYKARVEAEANNIPVYAILSDEQTAANAEQEALDKTRDKLHALDPVERFKQYQQERDSIVKQ